MQLQMQSGLGRAVGGRQIAVDVHAAVNTPSRVTRSRPASVNVSCSAQGPRTSGNASGSNFSDRQKERFTNSRRTVISRAQDYYDTLGVAKGSDKKEIKQAYRGMARKFHPDVNKEPGAEDNFKKIGEAYEVLSDDDKRAVYDRFGEAGLKGGMGGMGGTGDFTNPFDIFESFFGGGGMGGQQRGGARSRVVPGDDERFDVQLDFLEAVFGCTREIEINKLNGCRTCDGSGVKSGTSSSSCSTCNGNGQVVTSVRTPLGNFQQIASCPKCEGSGESFTPCGTCQGDGRVREKKRIQLRVPSGVDVGSRLRVRGEGGAGKRGGESGDLYVFINVKEHPELRREGINIMSDIEVLYTDAILGTTVKVSTVDGPVELRIPGGTQPGTMLLMAKRGVPRLGNAAVRGDHQVQVRVRIPKSVSGEEKQLIEQLREKARR